MSKLSSPVCELNLINYTHYLYRYVFLGFTKDGQFVISYSLQVDTDENTGFLPVYVYNLQWWWFIPYKPLKKVTGFKYLSFST